MSEKYQRKNQRMKNKNRANQENPPVRDEQTVGGTEDFVFGRYAVVEAIQSNRGNKLFIQEDLSGKRIEEAKSAAKTYAVPVQWVPKSKLDQLTDGAVHQGLVLGVTPFEYLTIEALVEQTKDKTAEPFLLILDGLEDPHNFGSILRTADASGVDGVIIPKHRAVGVTSIVTKTSTGAVEHIPIARVTNISNAIRTLKENNYWVFGTDMGGTDYREWNVTGAVALVIGNEGKGMSALLKKEVDEMLSIPMVGHVQSLNAGVAAGLLMYEVFRKRKN